MNISRAQSQAGNAAKLASFLPELAELPGIVSMSFTGQLDVFVKSQADFEIVRAHFGERIQERAESDGTHRFYKFVHDDALSIYFKVEISLARRSAAQQEE